EANELKQKFGSISYLKKIKIYKKSKYDMVKRQIKDYPNFIPDDISKRAKCLADLFWQNFKENSK
ncbi:TPA: hypothetical protein ACUMYV_001709, partial [Haemophilus influenzae]